MLAAAFAVALVLWRPEFGIALALALAPLANLQLTGGLKPFQAVLPALAVALVAYAFLSPHRARAASAGGLGLAAAAFLLAAVASSAQAIEPSKSVTKVGILLTSAAIFLAVTHFCESRRSQLVVAGGALAGLALAGAQGVAQNSLGLSGVAGFVAEGGLVHRVQGSFGHPNQFGGYLAFLIPFALALAATRGLGAIRGVAAFAALLGVPALVFSYARGAIGGLVLGALVWLGVVRPKLAVVVAVVVGAAALLLAPSTLRERFDPQATREDVPLRADIWAAAVDIYSTSPLLGVGVENYPVAYERLPTTGVSASQRRYLNEDELLTPPHAQNLYLNVLAEQGILGVAVLGWFLAAVVFFAYRASTAADPLVRALGLGAGAGIATVVLHSLLEVTLYSELAIPFFGVFAVVAVAVAPQRLPRRAASVRPLTTSARSEAESPASS